jgi:hypothetical protein
MSSMRPWHMLRQRRVPSTHAAAHMHGDMIALVEQLDGVRGDARLDLLAQQPMRRRVVMPLDVDVVIERHAADAPFGIHERLRWQRRQRRLVELLEQLATADAELAHRPGVEVVDQRRDRRIERGQREEALMA